MHKGVTPADIEKAMEKLMPVALSDRVVEEIENSLDQLAIDAHEHELLSFRPKGWRMITGVAVAFILCSLFSFLPPADHGAVTEIYDNEGDVESSEFVVIDQSDRVEKVEDDGVFIDQRGSAVRRVRVRVIGQRRMRDEYTGIVMTLTEPREETYVLPATKF